MPAVSVIIPAYNQGQYLALAIDSVLGQTMPDLEVLVVDDGSTDDTASVVESYHDRRVRYIYQHNHGLSAARNSGIRNATGEHLSFLDSDDLFLPAKLELLMAVLDSTPEVGLVSGQAIPVDEHGAQIGRIFDSRLPDDPAQLLLGNPLHVGSVLLRRCWQTRAGFFDEALRSYEDWDMWLRLALAGCRMTSIDTPVSLYRFHSAQMTRQQRQMTEASFAVLDNLYARTDLPAVWRNMEDEAFAQAHLRGAAQAYRSSEVDAAKSHMTKAVELSPNLVADDCEVLANQIAAWTELPKVGEPLAFMERVYGHLPEELGQLRARRSRDLGAYAMRQAFEAYKQGDAYGTRKACIRAFFYQPRWLANRGALSIFLRSWA